MSTATKRRHYVARTETAEPKFDAYQAVTDQIIAMLEAGTAPWHKPWDAACGMPRSLSSGRTYRGINPFLLQMAAIAGGYSSPWWATYKQIGERGGQVRRGEKSTSIVFWTRYTRKARDSGEEDRDVFVLRVYRVFNTDQADGLKVPAFTRATGGEVDPIAVCDETVAAYYVTGPDLVHGGDRACYSPSGDVVRMPERNAFETPEGYYGALFHETVHSTGHKDRLARPDLLNSHAFGDPSYSKEELVAELGSAFLSGVTGISAVTIANSASYLASWVRVLRGDNKLVISAAAQAQRAADLILGVTYDD